MDFICNPFSECIKKEINKSYKIRPDSTKSNENIPFKINKKLCKNFIDFFPF